MDFYEHSTILCKIMIMGTVMIIVNGLPPKNGTSEQPKKVELDSSIIKAIKRTSCRLLEEEIREIFSWEESDRYVAILRKYLSANVSPSASFLDKKISDSIEESVKRNLKEIRPALLALNTSEASEKIANVEKAFTQASTGGAQPSSSWKGKTDEEREKPWKTKKSFAQALGAHDSSGSTDSSQTEETGNRSMPTSESYLEAITRKKGEGKEDEDKREKPSETVRKTKKSFAQATSDSSQTEVTSNTTKLTSANSAKNATEESELLDDDDLKLLIIPTAHGGPRVFDELKRLNIKLEDFGVNRTNEFPSGAVLCECNSKSDREKLQNVINKLERVCVRPHQKFYPNSVRIQGLPIDVEEEEISESVSEQFNESPRDVQFIPYTDDRKHRLKGVSVYVSDPLYRKMEASPQIHIRERLYAIDPKIYIRRCTNCQLLGHRSKFCEARARPRPSPDDDCLDCTYYNEQLRKSTSKKARKFRDVKHSTDDDKCPSKLYLISKWKSLRRIDDKEGEYNLEH